VTEEALRRGAGLRHGVAGVTFDGRDGSVTQDVGGYRRAFGPWEAGPGPIEDGVVSPTVMARPRRLRKTESSAVIAPREDV
jgi:hypothetical protein